jgi:hypothetical protein
MHSIHFVYSGEKERLEFVAIFASLLNQNVRGKLMSKYYYKLCWRIELIAKYLCPIIAAQQTMLFGISYVGMTISTYYLPNAQQSWTFWFYSITDTIVMWFMLIGALISFAIFYLTVTYRLSIQTS